MELDEAVQNEPIFTEDRPAAEPLATEAPAATPAPTQTPTYKYQALGKEIEEPIDAILKRASMGYDYAQKMASFKTEKEQQDAAIAEAQGIKSRYQQIDEFARDNPGYNEFLTDQWNNRSTWNNGETPQTPAQPTGEIAALQSELTAVKQQLANISGFVDGEKQSREDGVLQTQVGEISKEYPTFDLTATRPEDGRSREMDVLEHMQQTGINDFQAAFRNLYHKEIVQAEVEKALKGNADQTKEDRSNGIMGRSTTPVLNSNVDLSKLTTAQQFEAMMTDPLWGDN